MAFRPLLRQRAVVPATSAILAAGLSLYPLRNVRAEAPQKSESPFERDLRNKPIYDDFVSVPAEPVSPPKAAPKPSAPTYTDRLAAEVAKARLFLHGYAAKTEDKVNDGLTEALRLENSFTSTIASLAPPRSRARRNVGDLIWTYEERYPVIAENHLRAKERVTRFVQTGIAHSKMSAAMLEEKIGEAREAIEDWVKKGK
ncbi:Apolipoprotein O [Botryosphaeria dothidea]|uniref:MICOS complex subunit n=1 Tax=Botryosphaeria dothidea TaxID=55169 RepID=A0A8H4IRM5_9PEZI|nr:Apolipoprotein O [Botryosphaeria dothidea]